MFDIGNSVIHNATGYIMKCRVEEKTLDRKVRSLVFENELLRATLLPDKGADIYGLTYLPKDIDVLWKSPWGVKAPGRGIPSAFNSTVSWLENYPGGWQIIFPNGGDPCQYQGVELSFHGEASTVPWEYEILDSSRHRITVRFRTRLYRSPFQLERLVQLESGKPILHIRETVRNYSQVSIDFMWGHHPAFGAPFLGPSCRIDIGARYLRADDLYKGSHNPLTPGKRYRWMRENGQDSDEIPAALSRVPDEQTPQDLLAYFEEFDEGWYGITNCDLGFGIGLVWPVDSFPFAWHWREMHASQGYPWYKSAYVMAIEPFTSIPGQGLEKVMNKTGTHRTLSPGESMSCEVKAVFYESRHGIYKIETDGTVRVRGGLRETK